MVPCFAPRTNRGHLGGKAGILQWRLGRHLDCRRPFNCSMKRRPAWATTKNAAGIRRRAPAVPKTRSPIRKRLINRNHPSQSRRRLTDLNGASSPGRTFRRSVRPSDSLRDIDPAHAPVESSPTVGSVSRTPRQQRLISIGVGAALAFVIYSSFGLETAVVFAFGYALALALPR